MSKTCLKDKLPITRNGCDQNGRVLKALAPESVKLHDLSVEDWMAFAFEFAQHVNLFEVDDNQHDGDWQDFFIRKDDIKAQLKIYSGKNELPPHLTLFVCFLELISLSQKRLNKLTRKHLNFYYKRILNLSNNEATPDQVHVIFELAKNASDTKLSKETKLKAAKDKQGNKMEYETTDELVVNGASVDILKNSCQYDNQGVRCEESPKPEDQSSWWPFGNPNLPITQVGFALASPVLKMKEGIRKMTFTFTFEDKILKKASKKTFPVAVKVMLSGEKQWLSAELSKGFPEVEGSDLKIVAELGADEDPILAYDQSKLGENFNTSNPVARIIFLQNDQNTGNKLLAALTGNKLNNISIGIVVSEMQSFSIENDLGSLDVSKPFLPFGPQPIKGSNFYVDCSEALDKDWSLLSLKMDWKDTPAYSTGDDHIKENYRGYRKDYLKVLGKNVYDLSTTNYTSDTEDGGLIVNNSGYFKVDVDTLEGDDSKPRSPDEGLVLLTKKSTEENYEFKLTIPAEDGEAKKTKNKGVSAQGSFLDNLFGSQSKLHELLKNEVLKNTFQNSFGIPGKEMTKQEKPTSKNELKSGSKEGVLRLSLKQSFLHTMFPRIYAMGMLKKAYIPTEPYTPLVETIRLGYSASVSKDYKQSVIVNDKLLLLSYLNDNIELFHELPFGQAEQHSCLKNQHDFLDEKNQTSCFLVPEFENGSLYLALKGAVQNQSVSLLVQALEGSENPTLKPEDEFAVGEKLQWFVLSHDEWKPLNKEYIINNTTDNFLKSGIVKFLLPKEATKNNHLIPGDYFWIKIDNPRGYNSVCQVIDIHAQAVQAQFKDNNNDLRHLDKGISAKTISKLIERVATIKKVEQPYNSFGGVSKESDERFYRRVSERLRHKQRAITTWDYEHLILEIYPDIYKVNCIRHTSSNCELEPGEVTVIVIPNIIRKNVYDQYQPRVSKAKLNGIATMINKLNTLHVDAKVENPEYQEVRVKLKVKFYQGKDENFYAKELKKDVAKFLSPWAFEKTADINFGTVLHESSMIHYIEKLGYVDYINDFQLFSNFGTPDEPDFKDVRRVEPSNSRVILTSVKYELHEIEMA